MPTLSKTRFVAARQCRKRLWLEVHRRELREPPDAAARERLAAGHEIGRVARRRWAGGVLVTEAPARHAAAVARTRDLVEDAGVPAIFEAAFEHGGVRVRVDALVRRGEAFDLVEVKSSLRVKAEHIDDLAVQAWVVDGSGIEISAAVLLHRSVSYRPVADEHERVFTAADITAEVLDRVGRVEALVRDDLRTLEGGEPDLPVGPHCTRPYPCPFRRYCDKDGPPRPPR